MDLVWSIIIAIIIIIAPSENNSGRRRLANESPQIDTNYNYSRDQIVSISLSLQKLHSPAVHSPRHPTLPTWTISQLHNPFRRHNGPV